MWWTRRTCRACIIVKRTSVSRISPKPPIRFCPEGHARVFGKPQLSSRIRYRFALGGAYSAAARLRRAAATFARVDLFLNEDDMSAQFCEFNADGSSGMNENREITASIADSGPFKAFAAAHQVRTCNEELFAGWVDEFLAKSTTPTI